MASTNKKYKSINDQISQQIINNQNTLEIITKLDQSLHSNDSYVTLKIVDQSGTETIAQFPTIGFLKQELDRISKSLKILQGIDGNPASIQIAQNSFKRIITADLNIEPKQIAGLSPVSVFKTNPNWIFDSFLNPKISIEIDLTGKIDQSIKSIQSRRFIVVFEQQVSQDANGNDVVSLTTLGAQRKSEFDQLYKGQSNIDLVSFVTWLESPGLVNRVDDTLIDEDTFKIEPNRLQYRGLFTVDSTQIDTINKKFWYVLDTLTYFDVSDPLSPPKPVQLKVGDLVNVNPNVAGVVSTTVYKVLEISTITSEFRVRFELLYGEEPIPTRLAALSIYSATVPQRNVRISIGFDEHCVVFIRPFDDQNNLIGREWSAGIGFWTNELKLDTPAGEQFSDFYVKKVYDYGLVLEDLVQKKVPNYYGLKPNAPLLDAANFKVVQTNQHLTNTVEAELIRDLHNNKNTIQSEISQIQEAVDKQNRIIETTVFDSSADRKRAEDELAGLQTRLKTKTETKVSVVQNILASQKNLNKISPVYSLRGFWPMPDPITDTRTQPQEVVQFEVWYKRTNKSGAENPIATFQDLTNSAARSSASANTTVNQNLSQPRTVNASFSNWEKIKTDSRKRVQDPISGQWKWVIEDVADADTPNINQLDIPINPSEVIQFKIKSLSEAGWPEAPVESEFSNLIEISFPDDLNNVLSDDQFILKEASADEIKVKFDRDLEARGLNLHLSTAVRVEDSYYAHRAEAIASGFKDQSGRIINLYEYLQSLLSKIASLEEQINRSKGVLDIYLVQAGQRTKVFNGNSLVFNINLEDYMQRTKIGLLNNPKDAPNTRTYRNDVYTISDFSLHIVNSASDSPLGLLSNRNYGQINGAQPAQFAYKQDSSGATPQAIWINRANSVLGIDRSVSLSAVNTDSQGPRICSQDNNQWLWLQTIDLAGKNIYTDVYGESTETSENPITWRDKNDFPNSVGISNRQVLSAVNPDLNIGMLRFKTGIQAAENNPGGSFLDNSDAIGTPLPYNFDISELKRWNVIVPSGARNYPNYAFDTRYARNDMATSIHPVINGFSDITDTSAQQTKLIQPGDANAVTIPLNIYFRPYTGADVFNIGGTPGTSVWLETSNILTGGDMPYINGANYTASAGKLQIPCNNSGRLQVGDKVVLVGLAAFGSTNALFNADSVPLRVINATATFIVVDYNVPGTFTNTTTGTDIVQVHLRSKKASGSSELTHFAVYGTLSGQDIPFVRNYVEISSTNTTPSPQVHNKSLRFYMENEQTIRPIEFQFTFNITQYKKITNVISNIGGGTNNNINSN